MIDFGVTERKAAELEQRMAGCKLYEKDIEEKFVRSSGHGGQNVNKTSTCVYLKHVPTGIEVKCMKDRSQSINRFFARRELVKRIENLAGQSDTELQKILKRTESMFLHFGDELVGSESPVWL